MKKDFFVVALLWLATTALGEALVLRANLFPLAAAEEAAIVDDAFMVMTVMAVPVFTFVLVSLGYSILRFRRKAADGQLEDGPPLRSHNGVVGVWLFVTTALTILVLIYPGITGLLELRARASEEADLVVTVEARQFFWRISYPAYDVTTTTELVLPVNKHVRFEVTSKDVLHSFWVPAFRTKIDAVPGMVTTEAATPNKTGTFDDDPNLRLQCAELCGVGHTVMTVPVRVLEQAEFDAWIAQQRQR